MSRGKQKRQRAFIDGEMVDLPRVAASDREPKSADEPTRTEMTVRYSRLTYPFHAKPRLVAVIESVRQHKEPTYEPEPEPEQVAWSAKLVRDRLAEAMWTLRRLPLGPTDWPSTRTTAELAVIHNVAEAYGHGAVRAKEIPTAEQISRMDECLPAWIMWLPTLEWRRAVIGVAWGIPLRRLGRMMGCSHATVANREARGVEFIALKLQGLA